MPNTKGSEYYRKKYPNMSWSEARKREKREKRSKAPETVTMLTVLLSMEKCDGYDSLVRCLKSGYDCSAQYHRYMNICSKKNQQV